MNASRGKVSSNKTSAVSDPTGTIYCRVSSHSQAKGDNILEQPPAGERIAERNGIRILRGVGENGCLMDNGVSGTLLEGRKLAWLLDQLESGALKLDFIIVRDFARLMRPDVDMDGPDRDRHIQQSIDDAGRIRGVLLRRNVKIIDERNTYDPADSLMWAIYTGLQSADLQNRRRALSGGKRYRLIAEGRYVWGYTPFGYRRTYRPDGSYFIEEEPARAAQLRQLFAWIVEGGYAHACRQAEKQKFDSASIGTKPNPNRTTRKKQWHGTTWNPYKWHRMTLRRLVRRAHSYATGRWDYEWRGEAAVVHLPKLIDHKLYLAVTRVAERRAPKSSAQVRLTTGMLACGKCGAYYAYNNVRRRKTGYIRCQGCRRQHRYDLIEPGLWRVALLRLAEMITAKLSLSPDDFEARAVERQREIEEVIRRQSKLYDAYERNLIDAGEYEKRYRALKADGSRLQSELAQIEVERRASIDAQQTRGTIEERAREFVSSSDRLVLSEDRRRERETLLVAMGGKRATVSDVGTKLAIVMPEVGSLPARAYELDLDDLEKTVSIVYGSATYAFRPLPRSSEDLGADTTRTGNDWEITIDMPIGQAAGGQALRKKSTRTTKVRAFLPSELPPGDTVNIDRAAQFVAEQEGGRASRAAARRREGRARDDRRAKRRPS